jgi:hypothetical protein
MPSSSSSYNVFTLDLTTARVGVQLVPPGTVWSQLSIRSLPAGYDLRLRVAGVNSDPVPFALGEIFIPDNPDGLESRGLYIDNTAQAGITAKIYVQLGNGS